MDREISRLVEIWGNILDDIIKLLARNGITIPAPANSDVVPASTQVAIARTVVILLEGDPAVPAPAGELTAAAILKWLTAGGLLEELYGDPVIWRLLAAELLLKEASLLAEKAKFVFDLRDSQN